MTKSECLRLVRRDEVAKDQPSADSHRLAAIVADLTIEQIGRGIDEMEGTDTDQLANALRELVAVKRAQSESK